MKIKNMIYLYIIFSCISYTTIQSTKLKETPIFQTIDQIKLYAQTHPEYPDIDNNDWTHPDYTSFYKKNLPTRLDRFFSILRIKSQPLWDAKQFKKLLENVTRFRENNGYVGRFVQNVYPDPGAKFIVWGDIFGAFHSLARCLEYLHKKKILDNNLKITDTNIYFVFKGNVIDLSPYILETLTIVLKLMEMNAENVIYLKGSHEEKETWLHFGLKNELKIKAAYISSEKIPLKKLINRLFQTLPLALYITGESDNTLKTIRLSYTGMEYPELNIKHFPQLFDTNDFDKKINIFNLKDVVPDQKTQVQIESIIKSPYKQEIIPREGLILDGKDKDAHSFVLFSSPTKIFRALHKFFYDAFSIIDIKSNFDDWTITLYNQDVREKLGIHKVETYNLSTGNIVSKVYIKLQNQIKQLETKLKTCEQQGQTIKKEVTLPEKPMAIATAPKVPIKKHPVETKQTPPTTKKIVVGSTVDTSGEFATIGKYIKDGLNPFIKKINLIMQEDNGTKKQINQNIKQLIEKQNIDIIFLPLVMVDPTLLQPFLEKVLCIFPMPPYNNTTRYVVNFGPTCEEIAQFSLQYAIEKEKIEKFAFFYQESIFKEAIKKLVEPLEKEKYITIPYDIQSIKLEDKAEKIRKFRPAALFLWVTPSTAKKIIKQIHPMNLTDTILFGYQLGTPQFKRFLEKNQLKSQYIGIESIPNPYNSDLEIMKECREQLGQSNNIFSAQAYICASIFVENIIKKIEGPVTKEKIIEKVEKIKNDSFKGLLLDFNSSNRSLYNTFWIDTGKADWIKSEIKKPQPKITTTSKPSTSVRENEIVFGTTMDFRGQLRGASKKTRFAIKHLFNLENEKGGINGKKLKLISENDDYKPKKAKANIEKMLKDDKIDIFLDPVGGPTTQAYLDLVEKGEILVLFPSTGAPVLRNPNLKYIINFRPSYDSIHIAAIKYVKEKEAVKKIAFVFQEGAASGKSVKLAIEKNNLQKDTYIEVPFSPGQTSFTEQAEKIKDFGPDAIAFWCPSVVLSKIVENIGAPNLKNTLLLTTEMGSLAALKYMKTVGLLDNFINTENIPSPLKSELPIMKQYREDLKAPDNFLAETYISTKYLIEVLKQIKAPITKEKIIAQMEQTKNYNLGGFMLNFDPATRQLSNQIWIYKAGQEIGKISTNV